MPGRSLEKIEHCVFLFGDSIPFGVGVGDEGNHGGAFAEKARADEQGVEFFLTPAKASPRAPLLGAGPRKAARGWLRVRSFFLFFVCGARETGCGQGSLGPFFPKYSLEQDEPKFRGAFSRNGSSGGIRPFMISVTRPVVGWLLGYQRIPAPEEERLHARVVGKIGAILKSGMAQP